MSCQMREKESKEALEKAKQRASQFRDCVDYVLYKTAGSRTLSGKPLQNHYNDKYVWRTMKCQTLEFPGFEYPGTMVKLGPGQYFNS